jgi:hypothetical protein
MAADSVASPGRPAHGQAGAYHRPPHRIRCAVRAMHLALLMGSPLSDQFDDMAARIVAKRHAATGKKIAVVGAGPAGLTVPLGSQPWLRHSAPGRPALFVGPVATILGSDFSGSFIGGYGSSPSRHGPCDPRACGRSRDRSPGSRARSFRTCQGLRPRWAAGQSEAEAEVRAQAVRYVPDCNAIEIVTTRNAGFLIPGSGSARCCSASLSLRPADSGPLTRGPSEAVQPLGFVPAVAPRRRGWTRTVEAADFRWHEILASRPIRKW